jgi:L-ribulose-5-phosphate 3-epimerase
LSPAPQTEQWVSDSIDAAKAAGLTVVLLAFFGKGDLKNDTPGRNEVIRRLKAIAPKAEKAGVILGLETWLDMNEHLYILDKVDSPNVQVYYDLGNSSHRGYDIYKEIRALGNKRICEVHAKDYAGKLFGQGQVDFWEVRRALDDIGYRGWIHIEGRQPFGQADSYRHDAHFLRTLFPPSR